MCTLVYQYTDLFFARQAESITSILSWISDTFALLVKIPTKCRILRLRKASTKTPCVQHSMVRSFWAPAMPHFLTSNVAAIASMLNLNQGEVINTNNDEAQQGQNKAVASNNQLWKVLIFDKFGQDIISSIMRVNDLRENGVTVHMYALSCLRESKRTTDHAKKCKGFYRKIDLHCLTYLLYILLNLHPKISRRSARYVIVGCLHLKRWSDISDGI